MFTKQYVKRARTGTESLSRLFLKLNVIMAFLLIALLLPGCGPKALFTASATAGQAPFTVTFENTSKNADEFSWNFGDGKTATSAVDEPVTHEYTLSGSHIVTLTVGRKEKPEKTSIFTMTITVEPGPVNEVKTIPETIELNIGQNTTFTAAVVDAYNNTISGAAFSWEASSAVGTITSGGALTAGTKAGTFEDSVTVTATLGGTTVKNSATVIVKPDPLEEVSVVTAQVGAGESQQLMAKALDQYNNVVSDASLAWTILDSSAGNISSDGIFTASPVMGSYANAVEVKATQGSISCTAAGQVTVIAGSLAQVYIGPEDADIGIQMTQQFVAIGTDKFGNRISGLQFTWSSTQEAGTIDQRGLFTSGSKSGDYAKAVKVEATKSGTTRSATADVTVESDHIVFISDRNNDQYDLYIMDSDGNNQERLTTDGITVGKYGFSPDGNRIIFTLDWDNLCTINLDGTWLIPVLSGREAYEPNWSPDGTKIAFQLWENGTSEIYVMNVDGSNLIRLTNNSAYDDLPAWSPDGKKIVFVSGRDGNHEIYVMNADGSDQKRLTNDSRSDTFPCWSPDGKEIVFQSDRNGRGIYIMNADGTNVRMLTSSTYSSNCPSFSPDGKKIVFHSFKDSDKGEIYIMNKDGSNMVRLTSNSDIDYVAMWIPRKKGAEVTEASIAVAPANNLKTMTAQEITTLARKAVVRIKTDLGSGSGFIISSDGYILTNNHMVSDAKEINVFLDDGTKYTATVKGRDLVQDLAVIKIDASGLAFLQIGDPVKVDLGEQVVVLGYPLGNESVSVTSGIISAIDFDCGRNITWLQTDSAINPGNSGGPMLNMKGQVVGIVSAKMVGVAVEGMGFAISANTINMYLARLKNGEIIDHY